MVAVHTSGDTITQVFEHDSRDPRHFEPACLGNRQPDELHQFGLGADKAFDLLGDGGDVGGEKAAVEAARAIGRRDRAGDKMDGA